MATKQYKQAGASRQALGGYRTEQPQQSRTPAVPRAYGRLLRRFLLRPIQNDQELAAAAGLADELEERAQLLPEEEAYLDVLCDLIEAYEHGHHPIPDVSPAEMLRFLIEQRGVTQQTVARETAIANSTITALLKRDRQMTTRHIDVLARYFGVPPAVFLPGAAGRAVLKRTKKPT